MWLANSYLIVYARAGPPRRPEGEISMFHTINNHNVFSVRFSMKKAMYVLLIFKKYYRIWLSWPISKDVWLPNFDLFKYRFSEGGCRDN